MARPSTSNAAAPGVGKGRLAGKGLARGVAKARRKVIKDAIRGITKGDIRRLARRGGVKRISAEIYDHIRGSLHSHLREILRNCSFYVEHSNRRTITVTDVIFALKRIGRPIYGFDKDTFDPKTMGGVKRRRI